MVKPKKFQFKLWRVVNDSRTEAVKWSHNGDSIIFNLPQFKKEYLDPNDSFCKSNNLSSFIRQLNLYGFKKVIDLTRNTRSREGLKEYTNENFIRGRPDLLHEVIRNNAVPNEQKCFIKKEVISDDENAKENCENYETKKSKRSQKKSKCISNNNCVTQLRRSKRKMEMISSEKKQSEEQKIYKTNEFQCCSSKRNEIMSQNIEKSQSPVTTISTSDLVSLKITQGKVVEQVQRSVPSTETQTKKLECLKTTPVKLDKVVTVNLNKDENIKKNNAWYSELNRPKIIISKATVHFAPAKTVTTKTLPPTEIKTKPIVPVINNPILLKAVEKINKNTSRVFDYSPDHHIKSVDVMLTSACTNVGVVLQPPECIFCFDVNHVSNYDLPSIDWTSFYNVR